MTIPQQAVEAATEAHLRHNPIESLNLGQYRSQITCSCGHTYQIDGHSEDRQESFLDHVNSDALTAALPALEQQIRAKVADEIRAMYPEMSHQVLITERRYALYDGMKYAAQIARGEHA